MCLFPGFRRPIFSYFSQVCQKLDSKTQKKITNSSGACVERKLGFNIYFLISSFAYGKRAAFLIAYPAKARAFASALGSVPMRRLQCI